MKKTLLYSFAVAASFTLAACNGDYDDWASPQSNAQEEAAAKYGVTFAAGPEATTALPDEDGTIQLVELSSTNENVAGYTIKAVTINGEEIAATTSGNYITVSAAALTALVEKQYDSRAAVARTLDVVSTVSINLASGDAVTVDAQGQTTATFTTYATPAKDANGYFILGDFANVGWNLSTPLWMTDNGDGTYTATVQTNNTGSNWFKFYAGSCYSSSDWTVADQGQMGCAENGDDALHNFLVYIGDPEYDGVQTPVITGQGQFNITLDMNNLTYTVARAESKYYIVGGINNPTWSSDACLKTMFYAEGTNVYSYTTKWPGAWDLKIWDGKDIGNWDKAWGTSVDGDGSASGSLVNSSSQSFQAPTKGEYYTLTINMSNNTYTWTLLDNQSPTEYTAVSLIGGFNDWNGDVDLTQEANAPHNWYVRATIDSDTELKFRANHGWDTSWGTSDADKDTAVGDVYYLSTGSQNITVPAGTYDFYLNDITGRWNIVPVE